MGEWQRAGMYASYDHACVACYTTCHAFTHHSVGDIIKTRTGEQPTLPVTIGNNYAGSSSQHFRWTESIQTTHVGLGGPTSPYLPAWPPHDCYAGDQFGPIYVRHVYSCGHYVFIFNLNFPFSACALGRICLRHLQLKKLNMISYKIIIS